MNAAREMLVPSYQAMKARYGEKPPGSGNWKLPDAAEFNRADRDRR